MNKIISVISVFFIALFGLTACSTTSDQNLEGEWAASINESLKFEAEVTSDSIEILLNMNGAKAPYWVGSFDPNESNTVVSVGDIDVLNGSLFGSSEESKEFVIENNNINFEFTIMGLEYDVEMKRVNK